MKAKVLLIEDDEMLGESIADNLSMSGFTTDWVKDGVKGLELSSKALHDIIILDIMLPGMNGLELLEQLRKKHQTPVLILSAKADANDRIRGLQLKADDYLAKPFHLEELLLRVESLFRRTSSNTAQIKEFKIANAIINFSKYQIISNLGEEIPITEKESQFLNFLVNNSNRVISREEILDKVWGLENFPSTRTIDNFILKFRKYIEPKPSNPQYFISHRGVGYSLQLEGEANE